MTKAMRKMLNKDRILPSMDEVCFTPSEKQELVERFVQIIATLETHPRHRPDQPSVELILRSLLLRAACEFDVIEDHPGFRPYVST
jgi:hypothetical protein